MQRRNIVNIINFIRTVEPRYPEYDLFLPVVRQLEMMKQYGLPSTFLLEYDALLEERYVNLLKKAQQNTHGIEIGLWLEIPQPLAEDAGLNWRGEGFWDWHSDVGFLIGYSVDERKRLIDTAMERFKTIFGNYPSSIGTWLIDVTSLAYIAEHYQPKAVCICRDQWGTDGYNLWGGYYNGAYYPSRNNMLCPAQTKDSQINLPVFRMLGSDPIYQYDSGLDEQHNPVPIQTVITLEAANEEGGADENWINWYLHEVFDEGNIPFGYTQAGQENSFSWPRMSKGFELQFEAFARERVKGKLEFENLSETGVWFQQNFSMTPPSVYKAQTDWKKEGRKSFWYSCMHYRVNVFVEHGNILLRDLTFFDQKYQERYIESVCTTHDCIFDNLPMVDGYRWSGDSIRAGFYLCAENQPIECESVEQLPDNKALALRINIPDKRILLTCDENGIHLDFGTTGGSLQLRFKQTDGTQIAADKTEIRYCYNKQHYRLEVQNGVVIGSEVISVCAIDEKLDIEFQYNGSDDRSESYNINRTHQALPVRS